MIAVSSLALASLGCRSTPKSSAEARATVESMPKWVVNPPVGPDTYYGVGTFESPSMKLAINQAHAVGRAEIAKQLTIKVSAVEKDFEEQAGPPKNADVSAASKEMFKTVTSETLIGSRVKEQRIIPKDGTYQVFALMELSTGATNQAMLAKMNADKALLSRFRATKAYQELDAEVKQYEKSQKP